MKNLNYLTVKELQEIVGVKSYSTARKEYRVIQDSLGIKRKLVKADLERYFGYSNSA